jgi:copper chaperone CopZ
MKQLIYIACLSVVIALTSCGGDTTVPAIADIDIVHTTSVGDAAKTIASISIEGMMCESACVGKVSKELNNMDCVSIAEIDFNTERDVDVANVEFDPSTCSAELMIEAIHNIGGGLYKVKGVKVTTYEVEA